jgi:cell division septum initiation protein DivIVA
MKPTNTRSFHPNKKSILRSASNAAQSLIGEALDEADPSWYDARQRFGVDTA